MTDNQTLLTFPCDFPIKAMGHNQPGFQDMILKVLQKKHVILTKKDITSRLSKNKKYISLTIMIRADNQAQIDQLYEILSNDPQIIMTL